MLPHYYYRYHYRYHYYHLEGMVGAGEVAMLIAVVLVAPIVVAAAASRRCRLEKWRSTCSIQGAFMYVCMNVCMYACMHVQKICMY
jgi:hypothetical protein